MHHGPRVETHAGWFCEAVWAGEYASGGFDLTDIVSGSGGRIRDGSITYVSSASTVDRLVSTQINDRFFVSNSLPCLLAAADGSVDPAYPGYYEDLITIIHGLDRYRPFISSTIGTIRLTYFDNLLWNGKDLKVEAKPAICRNFDSFKHYRTFLSGSLTLLAENMGARERKYPYRMLSTLSSGYDSPTVTVLAKEAGCSEAICIDKARGGSDEAGEVIASFLGIHPLRVERNSWRETSLPEPPFILGEGMGTDIPFKSAENALRGRVFLTGYHGDAVWAKKGKYLSEKIVRGDPSGLSLTEYRLWPGFIHCPLPFFGVKNIQSINAISNSCEMRPWDVSGDYTRPICRRLVEEAGVPREFFGQQKAVAGVLFDELLTPSSMERYLDWIKEHRRAWFRQGRFPPPASAEFEAWLEQHKDSMKRKLLRTPVLWRLGQDYPDALVRPSWLRRYLFGWALHVTKEKYRIGLKEASIHE